MEATAEKGQVEPYRELKMSVDRRSGSAVRGQLGMTTSLVDALLHLGAVAAFFTLLLMVVVGLSSLFCCDTLY